MLGLAAIQRLGQQGLVTGLSNIPNGLSWLLTGGRTFPPQHFALELDGEDSISVIRSVSGGGIRADVTTFQQGPNYYRSRQIGGKLKFEDLKLQVGMGASKPIWEWMKGFFTGKGIRQTGALSVGDKEFHERVRREFRGSMIHELTFPELDASQTEGEAYLTAALSMENMAFNPGRGWLPIAGGLAGVADQKNWLRSNFKFMLDGFNCSTVTKVDSFTVKHNVLEYFVGGRREPLKLPTWIEFPNITFYVPESASYEFDKAAEERIVRGKSPGYLTGSLEMLDKDGMPLCSVDFAGAEIVNVTADAADAAKDQAKLVKIEMSVEEMMFSYNMIATLQHYGAIGQSFVGPFANRTLSKAVSPGAPSMDVFRSPTAATNEIFKKT